MAFTIGAPLSSDNEEGRKSPWVSDKGGAKISLKYSYTVVHFNSGLTWKQNYFTGALSDQR